MSLTNESHEERLTSEKRKENHLIIDPMKKKRVYIDISIKPSQQDLPGRLKVKDLAQFLLLEEIYQPDVLLRWKQSSITVVGFIHGHYLFSYILQGSFPDLESYIHAKRLGMTNYQEYQELMRDEAKALELGFKSVDEYHQFRKSGFSTRDEWMLARKLGFQDQNTYNMAKQDGFDTFDEWNEFRKSPYFNARDFRDAKKLKCKDPISLYLYRILSDIEPNKSVAITKIQEMLKNSLRDAELAPSKQITRRRDSFSFFLRHEPPNHDFQKIIVDKLKTESLFKRLGEYDDFGEVFQRK